MLNAGGDGDAWDFCASGNGPSPDRAAVDTSRLFACRPSEKAMMNPTATVFPSNYVGLALAVFAIDSPPLSATITAEPSYTKEQHS